MIWNEGLFFWGRFSKGLSAISQCKRLHYYVQNIRDADADADADDDDDDDSGNYCCEAGETPKNHFL